MNNDRTHASGDPASGPHPDLANPTPDPAAGNDFPDAPPSQTAERPQDQPDLDAFAARIGTDRLADTDTAADDTSVAGRRDWRPPVSTALRGLSGGARRAAGRLQAMSEKLTGADDAASPRADEPIGLAELRQRVHGVHTTMVTTIDERGTLGSRPLTVQRVLDDGDVLFVVDEDADWVQPMVESVNVAFVDDRSTWISVSGRASLDHDPALLDELWDGALDAFFPDGRARAVVLHVHADRWEYWAAPGRLSQLVRVAAAKLGDDRPDLGTSGTVET